MRKHSIGVLADGKLLGTEIGLVREGMLIDLLLVEGDPLGSISILRDKARMPVVMEIGAFYRRDASLGVY